MFVERTICGVKVKSREDHSGLLWYDADLMGKVWLPPHGAVCVDAGFGPGGWTLVALARGASVIAFDPKPLCHNILSEHLSLNGFSRCCLVTAGLWSHTGTIPFGTNSFKDNSLWSPTPVIALDDFMGGFCITRLDYINLDVEGAELEVLEGAKRSIFRYRPRIIVEIHSGIHNGIVEDEIGAIHSYDFDRIGSHVLATPK